MRRLFSVFVLCGAASGVLPLNATAQEASLPKAFEPLTRMGRTLGLGWGDGYHACDRDCRLPTADLPPRSYAAGHALHPHYGQSNRQRWQAAAAANTPPAVYAYPSATPPHRPAGSGPQFAVPPSVMQEIRALENDSRKPAPPQPASDALPQPRSAADAQQRPTEPQLPAEPIAPPEPVQPPAMTTAPLLPRRAAPHIEAEPKQQGISQELDRMLDSLQDEEPSAPAAEPAAVDSILDGPLDDEPESLLDAGDGLLPAEDAAAVEQADDLLLDDSEDLLLDDQTRAAGFIREPVAGAVPRIPASQRIAQQRAQQQLAAQRRVRENTATQR